MSDLTKKDIKEVFAETLGPFARSVQGEFKKNDENFKDLRLELAVVKSDLSEVKADIKEMKTNSSELFGKIDNFITMYKSQADFSHDFNLMRLSLIRLL